MQPSSSSGFWCPPTRERRRRNEDCLWSFTCITGLALHFILVYISWSSQMQSQCLCCVSAVCFPSLQVCSSFFLGLQPEAIRLSLDRKLVQAFEDWKLAIVRRFKNTTRDTLGISQSPLQSGPAWQSPDPSNASCTSPAAISPIEWSPTRFGPTTSHPRALGKVLSSGGRPSLQHLKAMNPGEGHGVVAGGVACGSRGDHPEWMRGSLRQAGCAEPLTRAYAAKISRDILD